jgi:hypothetical protein
MTSCAAIRASRMWRIGFAAQTRAEITRGTQSGEHATSYSFMMRLERCSFQETTLGFLGLEKRSNADRFTNKQLHLLSLTLTESPRFGITLL